MAPAGRTETLSVPAPLGFRAIRCSRLLALVLAAPLGLAGCQNTNVAQGLRSAGIAGTPDEFMVLPTRPLEMPQDMAALPQPLPGTPNRVDYRPHEEAIAGLTGRPTIAAAGGEGLVAAAGPIDPTVRTQLAAEDVEWRRTHHGRLLERWFSTDRDALIYRPMVLNAPVAFDDMRATGVTVPPAPPGALKQE